MSVTIGIDVGGSATKIMGFIDQTPTQEPVIIRASDPLTSLYGAFGKFLNVNGLKIQDVDQIMVTGLGANFLQQPIYGIPTAKVEEFLCIGLGGLYLSGLEEALVVSMGTGTAFIHAANGQSVHMGGSGVGGGTISGLASKMLNTHDIDYLLEMGGRGDISKVDLVIRDIAPESSQVPLGEDVTVSNFGKLTDDASPEDVALGLLNMTFQTIGVMSYFLTKVTKDKNVVLTGKLSTFPIAKRLCDAIGELYGVNFIVPEKSEFATATGAALAFINNKEYTRI